MSVELFYQKVYDVTSRIPSGKVATYGQIAALCGNPRAARAVGNALHRNPFPETVPCFRVDLKEYLWDGNIDSEI